MFDFNGDFLVLGEAAFLGFSGVLGEASFFSFFSGDFFGVEAFFSLDFLGDFFGDFVDDFFGDFVEDFFFFEEANSSEGLYVFISFS